MNCYKIQDISFPDYDVINMHIDRAAKMVTFSMEGAWTEHPIGAGELILSFWESLHQRSYNYDKKNWVDIPSGQEEFFKGILKLDVDRNQIVMRGFGAVQGEWIELAEKGGRGEYRTQVDHCGAGNIPLRSRLFN